MPHTHGTVNEVTRGSKAHQRRLMMTLTLTGTVFVAEIVGAIQLSPRPYRPRSPYCRCRRSDKSPRLRI